ncbi:hypothetical protein [Hyunsoonleella aquatilis]|nr:hypothetical protein [Hyunsoonleella aquatilis]
MGLFAYFKVMRNTDYQIDNYLKISGLSYTSSGSFYKFAPIKNT